MRTSNVMKVLGMAAAVASLPACSAGPPPAPDPEAVPAVASVEPSREATTTPLTSVGSLAYSVGTIEELAARADVIVSGRLSETGWIESADEERLSGLTNLTRPFDAASWLKGSGPDSLPVIELQLIQTGYEIAQLRGGTEYVLFLNAGTIRGEARYGLVGGVGAHEVRENGYLTRIDDASDGFPQHFSSWAELSEAVENAPARWAEHP